MVSAIKAAVFLTFKLFKTFLQFAAAALKLKLFLLLLLIKTPSVRGQGTGSHLIPKPCETWLDSKGYKLVTAVTVFVTFYIIVAELLFVKLFKGGVFVQNQQKRTVVFTSTYH
ncbi:MAG: hypothetical protein K2K44_00200 [Oscillospiraceae bacterium]|nr:hypothetical protein [Oscillospiraceae bacterium]